jgi:2-haloalkanoic acid dehalogenase type II
VRPYDAVLFDLLTALLDSWALWNDVAGSAEAGQRWRAAYLRQTYATGAYRPYETLVAEAAESVGLDRGLADTLDARYAELRPWPGVVPVLSRLAEAGLKLGIVTNCSRRLGQVAVERLGVAFDCVVTAEEAGWYKPNPQPYQLALDRLGVTAARSLFVAGSAYDLFGTAPLGLATFWHDRIGMALPDGAPAPLLHARDLDGLPALCGLA